MDEEISHRCFAVIRACLRERIVLIVADGDCRLLCFRFGCRRRSTLLFLLRWSTRRLLQSECIGEALWGNHVSHLQDPRRPAELDLIPVLSWNVEGRVALLKQRLNSRPGIQRNGFLVSIHFYLHSTKDVDHNSASTRHYTLQVVRLLYRLVLAEKPKT